EECLIFGMRFGVPFDGRKRLQHTGLTPENGESFSDDIVQELLFEGVEIERHGSPLALREYQDTKLVAEIPCAGRYDRFRSDVDLSRLADRFTYVALADERDDSRGRRRLSRSHRRSLDRSRWGGLPGG